MVLQNGPLMNERNVFALLHQVVQGVSNVSTGELLHVVGHSIKPNREKNVIVDLEQ